MEPVRVLIVDDQAITRGGLCSLLASVPGLELVGEAADGAAAVALADELQPDVVLMDLRMPGINGIEATRRIHRVNPRIGILVVTIFEDDTSVFPAIRAGARGYLLKDADQAELLRAIHTVAGGGVIFSPGIAGRVLQYLSNSPPPAPAVAQMFDELTGREREILELLTRGDTNAEIAARLGLSPKTVSNHVSNVLLKVQATDRAKLMLLALEAGLGQGRRPP
ncbi:MAG: Two-component transcriptional response regulator, LuxR family [uncultured Thermomicrobiales bacterium]|uniref:Two-component transcriptional response regulator, LuxR family n=1 Tax=uncultured Thermomicrobiales bacterium TaxID=1645740 RepID=A0A6J4VA72_9BACT|nr:MAG: Two-component transcriptional response regulator, LuxR family [uncultured Thermomicrobiales bacterium]